VVLDTHLLPTSILCGVLGAISSDVESVWNYTAIYCGR
jgi:hypothetical protein